VLQPGDRVELLEGLIVEKMNQRPIHGFLVGLLNEFFQQRLPPGWIARCQLPMTTEKSEPEPDLVILRGSHEDFRERHPTGAECRLIIEVADTSLEKDRVKADIYRAAGVQQYWIVNVAEKCIERYEFSGTRTTEQPVRISGEGQVVFACDDAEITVMLDRIFQ
jgi:Uma2 family endonuclease